MEWQLFARAIHQNLYISEGICTLSLVTGRSHAHFVQLTINAMYVYVNTRMKYHIIVLSLYVVYCFVIRLL